MKLLALLLLLTSCTRYEYDIDDNGRKIRYRITNQRFYLGTSPHNNGYIQIKDTTRKK